MDCQLTALMHAGHVGPAFLSPWLLAVLFLLVGRWLYLRPRCLPADVLGLVKSSSAREAVPYKHVLLCVYKCCYRTVACKWGCRLTVNPVFGFDECCQIIFPEEFT